jgi:hypothetical protein
MADTTTRRNLLLATAALPIAAAVADAPLRAMPRSEAGVRALLRELRGRGDPFGVAGDPELQRIASVTASARCEAEPTPVNLAARLAVDAAIEALRAVPR